MSRLSSARLPRLKVGPKIAIAAGLVAALGGIAFAAQDKYSLKALDGVSFSEIRGYENWATVAVSQVDEGQKVIVANPLMIDAYLRGVPENGKPFPDGVKIVKIEWSQKKNPVSPYSVFVPDKLMSVSLIEKDSKRFPNSSGWGYAQFIYDPATETFRSYGTDASFGTKVCYACHTAVAARDYIFTAYARR